MASKLGPISDEEEEEEEQTRNGLRKWIWLWGLKEPTKGFENEDELEEEEDMEVKETTGIMEAEIAIEMLSEINSLPPKNFFFNFKLLLLRSSRISLFILFYFILLRVFFHWCPWIIRGVTSWHLILNFWHTATRLWKFWQITANW